MVSLLGAVLVAMGRLRVRAAGDVPAPGGWAAAPGPPPRPGRCAGTGVFGYAVTRTLTGPVPGGCSRSFSAGCQDAARGSARSLRTASRSLMRYLLRRGPSPP